ncbi:MAG: glycoside hydrolase family 57 protein [Candidatus Firestonebacteria bacterium]
MSDDNFIHIAFLWHMHQPFYKDLEDGKYVMPWVRLHCIKDYYRMVALLDEFPQIKLTFNLVPSLIVQIEDYAFNNATDNLLDLTLKKATDLTENDKVFILWNFFMANGDNMIRVYPRYLELLEKRGYYVSLKELSKNCESFNTQDYLDLQILFNLAWFDPVTIAEDKELSRLKKKERRFSEEDKSILISKQKEIISKIIPKYKEVRQRKQIEISTTPFYHPILPLIYDTNIAKVSLPDVNIPFRFHSPSDAEMHIKKSVELYLDRFGEKPTGLWPAEGGVSEDIIPLIQKEGIKWMATDEEILMNSLDNIDKKENVLYKPYKIKKDNSELNIIFRDKELADLIGFVYSKWDAETAANDFINRIYNIAKNTNIKNPLISIILDGENAWEYYKNNGIDFLRSLYGKLSNDSNIKTVTVSEYLNKFPAVDTLPKLYPGSWINHNFYIWIGHKEDIKAWEYLYKTKEDVQSWMDNINPQIYEKIKEELLIAEGSDWCWWYGDDHSSLLDEEFDYLFRKHLLNIYKFAGKEPPSYLLTPIVLATKNILPQFLPSAFLQPQIDGKITNFYEWSCAGIYEVAKSSSSIHRANTIVKSIYFGFNLETLYLRFDFNILLNSESFKNLNFELVFINLDSRKLVFEVNPSNYEVKHSFYIKNDEKSEWIEVVNLDIKISALKIVEISIPFKVLSVQEKDNITMILTVFKNKNEIEKWPPTGVVGLTIPGEDFESIMWQV